MKKRKKLDLGDIKIHPNQLQLFDPDHNELVKQRIKKWPKNENSNSKGRVAQAGC